MEPPAETLAALVDDLYAPLGSFAISVATMTFVGGLASSRTGNSLLTILTVCAAAVAAARLAMGLKYRSQKPAIVSNAVVLSRWEHWFAIGAWAYGACLGGLCFIVFAFADDPLSQLLLNATAVGYTAGITARNSSRPQIAIVQLSFVLLPIMMGSAIHPGLVYAVLSAITFLYYVATIEITQYLGRHRLHLLELAHSLTEQNVRFDAALTNMAQGLCMFDRQQQLLISNRRFAEIFHIPCRLAK